MWLDFFVQVAFPLTCGCLAAAAIGGLRISRAHREAHDEALGLEVEEFHAVADQWQHQENLALLEHELLGKDFLLSLWETDALGHPATCVDCPGMLRDAGLISRDEWHTAVQANIASINARQMVRR